MHLNYRQSCRICGSTALTSIIDLGEQYLQGSFIHQNKPLPPLRKVPTELVRCDPMRDENACGLLQTRVSVPPVILYTNYWYRSGTNQTMRDHLSGIVEEALSLLAQDSGNVLDIGCNDGTLLHCYPDGFKKFGVDPSDIAGEIPPPVHVIQDIFPSAELSKLAGTDKFDVITSIAMFYDLEDPASFVNAVKEILAPTGMWIFEMSYMPFMLSNNSYDTICHEHLEYYSFAVIEKLLSRCGLKIVKATFSRINGGSIRCIATHQDNFRYKNPELRQQIKDIRRQEFELELDTDKPYRMFQEKIEAHRQELSSLLKGLKAENRSIHVYGASTKGNTILQWCGLDKSIIDYAADRNPEKDGARTIGTDIPIISEEKSRAMNPDYYLVLPWHFRDEFLVREKAALDKGTKFIFPLPEIEIYPK